MAVAYDIQGIVNEFKNCIGYVIKDVKIIERKGLIFSHDVIQIDMVDSSGTKGCAVTFPV